MRDKPRADPGRWLEREVSAGACRKDVNKTTAEAKMSVSERHLRFLRGDSHPAEGQIYWLRPNSVPLPARKVPTTCTGSPRCPQRKSV